MFLNPIRRELELFFGALRFFTRLPIPGWVGHREVQLNRASRYFPAAGLIVGLIGALVWQASRLFWPPALAILLALAATVWVTGAFHEDGLSDTADGFGGAWEKGRILEIMKDSRIGVFGVVVLVFVLLGRFVALLELPEGRVMAALLAGHTVSRFCAATLLCWLDYVRKDALAKAKSLATKMTLVDLGIAGLIAFFPCLLLPLENLFWGFCLAALTTFGLARFFRRWIGGYTGDCLGATQQAAELAFYLGLLAHLPSA